MKKIVKFNTINEVHDFFEEVGLVRNFHMEKGSIIAIDEFGEKTEFKTLEEASDFANQYLSDMGNNNVGKSTIEEIVETLVTDCEHKAVNIIPTLETAYGLEDKYILKCADCNDNLLCYKDIYEIAQYILKNSMKIRYGNKYIPRDVGLINCK